MTDPTTFLDRSVAQRNAFISDPDGYAEAIKGES